MFGVKHPPVGDKLAFLIQGMHCPSCCLNIDGELEDMEGVIESSTNYAKATCQVIYDAKIITPDSIKQVIINLGYQVKDIS